MISYFIQKVIYVDSGIVSFGQWKPFQSIFCALYMSSSFFMDFIVLPAQCLSSGISHFPQEALVPFSEGW